MKSTRQIRLPKRYTDYALTSIVLNVIEPMTFNKTNAHEEWRKEMKEEYDSIIKNKSRN